MTDIHRLNSQYYFYHAIRYANSTYQVDMDELYQIFIDNLPDSNQHILDLGCGSGRDAAYFAGLGYQVMAIDGSQALIDWAKSHYGEQIEWQCMAFLQMPFQNMRRQFTGIWACASLLHVPYVELPFLFKNLLNTLKDNGVFYASFKYGDSERIDEGRFFCDMNEARIDKIIASLDKPFTFKTWITEDQRVDRQDKWLNLMVSKYQKSVKPSYGAPSTP